MLLKNFYIFTLQKLCNNGQLLIGKIHTGAGTEPNGAGYLGDLTTTTNTNGSFNITRVETGYYGYGGIIFGDGDTPVQYEDYKLSGNIITTVSGSVTVTKANNSGVIKASVLLTNTGSSPITVREMAIIGRTYTNANFNAIIDRTVLDSPVTIQPNEYASIVYTIEIA